MEVEPLGVMVIDYGSDQLVSQPLPTIDDTFGLMSMGFCQLAYEVVLGRGLKQRRLQGASSAALPEHGSASTQYLSLTGSQINL